MSSFSPGDRKWESGEMSVAEAVTGAATRAVAAKTAASGVDSFSRVIAQLVASSVELLLTSPFLCFSLPFFVTVNVFAF